MVELLVGAAAVRGIALAVGDARPRGKREAGWCWWACCGADRPKNGSGRYLWRAFLSVGALFDGGCNGWLGVITVHGWKVHHASSRRQGSRGRAEDGDDEPLGTHH